MALVIELLPNKHEALSSVSSTTKKKKHIPDPHRQTKPGAELETLVENTSDDFVAHSSSRATGQRIAVTQILPMCRTSHSFLTSVTETSEGSYMNFYIQTIIDLCVCMYNLYEICICMYLLYIHICI
jgi:hypothetical protein